MTETGRCNKCDSEISVNAERCPECGYEPGSGSILDAIFGSIMALILVPIVGFGVLMVVIIPLLMISGGLGVRNGIFGMLLFGAMAFIPILVVSLAVYKLNPDEKVTPVNH